MQTEFIVIPIREWQTLNTVATIAVMLAFFCAATCVYLILTRRPR